jgi:hypothetical protein
MPDSQIVLPRITRENAVVFTGGFGWLVGDPYTGLSRAVEVESILRVARYPP